MRIKRSQYLFQIGDFFASRSVIGRGRHGQSSQPENPPSFLYKPSLSTISFYAILPRPINSRPYQFRNRLARRQTNRPAGLIVGFAVGVDAEAVVDGGREVGGGAGVGGGEGGVAVGSAVDLAAADAAAGEQHAIAFRPVFPAVVALGDLRRST